MVQRSSAIAPADPAAPRIPSPAPYRIDPADPRAPSEAEWIQMSQAERDRVVAMLPAEVPLEAEARAAELEQKLAATEEKLALALAELERLRGGG